jgi:plastocyanin
MDRSRSQPDAPWRPAARLSLPLLLGVALLSFGAAGGRAAAPTVAATGTSLASYAWTPSSAEVESGGSVAFENETATPHGLVWESGPETPSCTGIPSAGQGNWGGSCSFSQGGAYAFYCPVHPAQMKGAITVKGPAAPLVNTGTASAVSESGATLNGTVNPSGQATSYYFEYGPTTTYGQKTTEASAGEGSSPVAKSATVGGLTAGTLYHFRLVASNGTGESLGSDRTFTTSGPPSATTGTATAVGDTEATLKGTVSPNGFATTYFFNWGTTDAYGEKTTEVSAGAGTTAVQVSAPLTGLSPETTYHFQLVAKSAAGMTAGLDRTFVTSAVPPAEPPPTITPPSLAPAPLPSPAAAAPPDTKITLKPKAKTRDRTPTVKFSATVADATFRCSVGGKPFKACRSPFTTPTLKPGRHKIRIAALAGGLTDPAPASCVFKVLATRK